MEDAVEDAGEEPAEKTDESSATETVSIADQIEALKTELKEICKCQVRMHIQDLKNLTLF